MQVMRTSCLPLLQMPLALKVMNSGYVSRLCFSSEDTNINKCILFFMSTVIVKAVLIHKYTVVILFCHNHQGVV